MLDRMISNLPSFLETAQSIAREAGDLLREAYRHPRNVRYKGKVDLVTEADERAEALIVGRLGEAFPDHAILAEEGGQSTPDADYLWLVDPLDGTTNFAHSFPVFAVSMALRDPEGLLLGVIFDPLRDELFSAMRGGGATLNGQAMRVTNEDDLNRALLATGFAYDRHTAEDNNSVAFARFLRRAQGLRRAGAAALDMAYVACGRVDGFWEMKVQPWDVAAGALMVHEAGGVVTDYAGKPRDDLARGAQVLATNPALLPEMLAILAQTD